MHFCKKIVKSVIAQQQQGLANPCPANDRSYSPNANHYNYIIWMEHMSLQNTVGFMIN